MKISISYPPLKSAKGVALLSQNRQFQWFNKPTYIYPVIPAYAATLLQHNGYDVIWDDGIAEDKTFQQWLADVKTNTPDLMAIESKTPTIKRYWKLVDRIKEEFPEMKIVLYGDHVTYLPEESLINCKADYILTGGHYDFQLLSLANVLSGREETLRPGFYFWDGDVIRNTGKFDNKKDDVTKLPMMDRSLTKWELYATENGNFKFYPGTYTMVGRDCWWRKDGGCTFCSWTSTYPEFKVRTVEQSLDEVGVCIEKYGIKEIFDDTGTFPIGKWLKDFCNGMIERGYNKNIVMGCNMRSDALKKEEYDLMGKANFRFILYGVESANQISRERLNKGTKPGDIEQSSKWAKDAGMDPHLTCMVGYPWETLEEARNTVRLVTDLFKKGQIETMQATICMPYPGTKLFEEAKKEGWLKTLDWDEYDMRKPIMHIPGVSDEEILEVTQELYKSALNLKFIAKKLAGIRNFHEFMYLAKAGLQLLGHLKDFRKKQPVDKKDHYLVQST